jgi:hypothetical protein
MPTSNHNYVHTPFQNTLHNLTNFMKRSPTREANSRSASQGPLPCSEQPTTSGHYPEGDEYRVYLHIYLSIHFNIIPSTPVLQAVEVISV